MRARTMLTLPSSGEQTEGDPCSSRRSGTDASTILLGITALFPIMFMYPLVTLCVNSSGSGVLKFLWWAAWVGLAFAALASILVVCYGELRWLPRRPAARGTAAAAVVIPAGLMMASMWFLADYSYAHLAEADAREVVDVQVGRLGEVASQDGVALVALRRGEGYIPPLGNASGGSAPNRLLVTSFNYGCHGEFVPKMCCEVGMGIVQDAANQCHNCSYWRYPDLCPGAELFHVAPLWHDQGSAGGRPAAIAFQSRALLFGTDAARSAWALSLQASPPAFASEFCRGGRLCAFVPRNVHVQAHWDHWHRGDAASVMSPAVGEHGYEGAPAPVSLARARDLAAAQMQALGRPGEQVPLLWVPADTHASFSAWESRLSESERSGEVGRALLFVTAGYFGLTALGSALWTHGRACVRASGKGSGSAAEGAGAEPSSSV